MKTLHFTDEQFQALQNVLDYLREEEADHYEEMECPENHIYESVMKVDEVINPE